jgi:subtilase family serine protease
LSSYSEQHIPEGFVSLPGSERRPPKDAKFLGSADEKERFNVTIVLRRRTDGAPLPDIDYFTKTPPLQRKKYTQEEFAANFGAHPDDISKVVKFAKQSGLEVIEMNPARRAVVVSGTVAQMSKAFAVKLGCYQQTVIRQQRRRPHPVSEIYRGRDGFINVPTDLAEIIVGVFGLDNRSISHRSSVDPQNTTTVTVQQVAKLYDFPANTAAGQTIGIVSTSNGFGGYFQSDLQLYFGASMPLVTPISADGTNNGCIEAVTTVQASAGSNVLTFASTAGIPQNSWPYPYGPVFHVQDPYNLVVTAVTATTVTLNTPLTADVPVGTHIYFNPDGETTQDICIAASAAPGANIAVFFAEDSQNGWIQTIQRAAFPNPGDPICSVLSSSWFFSGGDDQYGLNRFGVTLAMIDAMHQYFQDAAILGNITICICSGDWGSNSQCGKFVTNTNPLTYGGDGKAHVLYPASDPWVLAVGGTTIGNIGKNNDPSAFDEYVWNDPPLFSLTSWAGFYQWGTTGGGVSDHFPRPLWQDNAGVPPSVNDGHVGRGIPDVAGNASINSGYSGIFVAGDSSNPGNGTSASTPHWAGLIAVINAALGYPVGFINPSLYELGSSVFRDINAPPGPADNSNFGIAGYPAGPGWDACTGWGSPNGIALLTALQNLQVVYISGGYQSYDVILTDLATNQQIPIGGAPGGPWDTLLKPNTAYGFSARVHNDSSIPEDVVVRFWEIPGGVGTNGTLVGTPQTVTIPPYSSITVQASANFTSAPPLDHICAVVSISCPTAGCAVDAQNALQIPDPGLAGTRSCSAWRNTDSMNATSGSGFSFKLGMGKIPFHETKPILLQIQPIHVPFNWDQVKGTKDIGDVLRFMGAEKSIPLYFVPEINRQFQSMHLNPKIAAIHGAKIEEIEASRWHLIPHDNEQNVSFEISGEIPKTAKKGDIVLVKVTAHYPKTENRASRSTEFLEVIHVTG